ncbi:AAA family ATPase [Streptomyces sp. NPDC000229]|uniref:AAA family ATPase n=1 Tax=Streptomyces sp. NPDC000229 TaxID=3154247 RepID=UPI003327F7C2
MCRWVRALQHLSTPARSASTRQSNGEDDAGDQSATREAVALQDLLISARLTRGLTTVVDSTNVEARVRRGLVHHARQHGRPAAAVVFLTCLYTCEARNSRRPANRRVPSPVLRQQHEQTEAAVPLLADEGFTDIRTVGGDHR